MVNQYKQKWRKDSIKFDFYYGLMVALSQNAAWWWVIFITVTTLMWLAICYFHFQKRFFSDGFWAEEENKKEREKHIKINGWSANVIIKLRCFGKVQIRADDKSVKVWKTSVR